ncbi:putative prolyl-tRNA synthetase [Baffinella frigidus]|nr:putative prolyl-tRNA synthetase [Cryptophyta sp. CCMP2293]
MSLAEQQAALFAKLTELGIKTKTIEHAQCFTAEDVEGVAKDGSMEPESGRCKNMFLKSKKGDLFCFALPTTAKVDMKVVSKKLAAPECRFAGDEYLSSVLKVVKGSVTPFAAINDTETKCTFALDKRLMDQETLWFHPLHNDKSTAISATDLVKFLEGVGHKAVILDFSDVPPAGEAAPPAAKPAKPVKPAKAEKGEKAKGGGEGSKADMTKETMLGMSSKKDEDFSGWYSEVITKGDMIDYYDISGCYILKPWSFAIWEAIQAFLDGEIKKMGVQGCYFPMFVSQKALEAEKDHIAGFSPEVAWVTKSGQSELDQPIAVRPTSETIMYPAFAKWIRSHRDLPLRLNQWCNVVRWEFKNPTPFIRTREFLWQEGHTAHATLEAAAEEVLDVLDVYRRVYEDLLCVPVVKGKKTEVEKFAGGYYTTTVEAFIPGTARGIQGVTSHNLGKGGVWSAGLMQKRIPSRMTRVTGNRMTTRTIGVMVMIHSDNQGLVLPPRVAPVQVVIVPVIYKDSADTLIAKANELCTKLKAAGVRCEVDSRSNYTAGWKYNHWEQKGVPIRLELGPKDFANDQVRMVRRFDNSKEDVPLAVLTPKMILELELIQHGMLKRAKAEHSQRTTTVMKWEEFVPALDAGCMCLTPFCNEVEWEEAAKKRSQEEKLAAMGEEEEDERTAVSSAAKTLCIPFDQPELPAGTLCFISGKPAECWVLWGRSY